MPYRPWANRSIAISILFFGIMAGFFYTYSFNVNRAMEHVDSRTYAHVQSLFNHNVRHWIFFAFFFGSGISSVVTLGMNWAYRRERSFWLLVAASILYLGGIIVFTQVVNLPLNAYTESWNPQAVPADWMATRDAWNQANLWRVVFAGAGFVGYIIVLLQRASRPPARTGRHDAGTAITV